MENIVRTEQLYEGKAKRVLQQIMTTMLLSITKMMLQHSTVKKKVP